MKSVVNRVVHQVTTGSGVSCPLCKGEHGITVCKKFLELNPFPRSNKVKSMKLCFGCLSSKHTLNECTAPLCTHCSFGKRHHELLCFVFCDNQKKKETNCGHISVQPEIISVADSGEVILGTALLKIQTANGDFKFARALLDNGSQANLISEECVQPLNLPRTVPNTAVCPLGGERIGVRGQVRLTVAPGSGNGNFRLSTSAYVIPRLNTILPGAPFNGGKWPKPVMDNLADPNFTVPDGIDILLGAHIWGRILKSSFHRSQSNRLIAQNTSLGWVISGGTDETNQKIVSMLHVYKPSNEELHASLQKFWELDQPEDRRLRSEGEQLCEDFFVRHYKRTESGRYQVAIPIKPDALPLGESKNRAWRQFRRIENKFRMDPDYRGKYIAFMDKFFVNGYLTGVTEIDESKPHYFVPHHGIDPERKKFRIVLNGSAITSSGQSFNDLQMAGERLQDNLADIILRFRLHRIALTGDIEQMYPQVLIRPEDYQMQLIFWRPKRNQPIKIYAINRVMFGFKYSSHCAIRSMQQCARDEANNFPIASKVALQDYYVDDMISGTDTEDEAIELQRQMQSMMASGGFPVKKWSTNNWLVLTEIEGGVTSSSQPYEFGECENQSVLGVIWNPAEDSFRFIVNESRWSEKSTKRTVTSDVAKLYDPLGLVAPIIILGKIIIRDLWYENMAWDDELNESISFKWTSYRSSLKQIECMRIPRWIGATNFVMLPIRHMRRLFTSKFIKLMEKCVVVF